jgi:hypothetical protein
MLPHSPSQTLCVLNDGSQFTNHHPEGNCIVIGQDNWYL